MSVWISGSCFNVRLFILGWSLLRLSRILLSRWQPSAANPGRTWRGARAVQLRSLITYHLPQLRLRRGKPGESRAYGRGLGVGRTRGVGVALGVEIGVGLTVGLPVAVGVAVGVTVGVGVTLGFGVEVGVGVGVRVAVGVGVAVAVGVKVGVGVGVPPGTAKAYTLLSPAT